MNPCSSPPYFHLLCICVFERSSRKERRKMPILITLALSIINSNHQIITTIPVLILINYHYLLKDPYCFSFFNSIFFKLCFCLFFDSIHFVAPFQVNTFYLLVFLYINYSIPFISFFNFLFYVYYCKYFWYIIY